jgi:YhcH/YjgK/YiaL family protein
MLLLTTPEQYGLIPGERMDRALRFLKEIRLLSLTPGTDIPIDGDAVFARVQVYTTLDPGLVRYETHDRYYDLHYVTEGREYFYCAKRRGLVPAAGYDQDGDITFYNDPLHGGRILLQRGDLVVVSPAEAHKSRCAVENPGIVKKIVIKVRV